MKINNWQLAVSGVLVVGGFAYLYAKGRIRPRFMEPPTEPGVTTIESGLSPIRKAIVANATTAIGLNASTRTAEFEDFLGGPGEAANMKASMATAPQSSTCGLTARAIYRLSGFKDASLSAPYQIGSAISALVDMAKKHGAWVDGVAGAPPPRPGDVVMGDVDKPSGHVWTIIEVDPDGKHFHSVDGGAVDALGHQSVAERTRTWTTSGGRIIDTPNIGNVHTITGWIDADKLAAEEAIS